MMRKSTTAIPSDRIQLSNQRPSTERRVGGGDGSRRDGSVPLPASGAPKSSMRLILAMRPARRNSYAPSSGPNPLPDSDSEFGHRVLVTHAGGQTRHSTFPLHAR